MTDQTSPVTETLASFGTERKRIWILKFEDADRGDMNFDDESDAHHAYENFSVGWNCTLLETSDRKYDVRCGKLVPLSHAPTPAAPIQRRSREDALLRILGTIARFPVTDPKNMDAINMRLIAEGAIQIDSALSNTSTGGNSK